MILVLHAVRQFLQRGGVIIMAGHMRYSKIVVNFIVPATGGMCAGGARVAWNVSWPPITFNGGPV